MQLCPRKAAIFTPAAVLESGEPPGLVASEFFAVWLGRSQLVPPGGARHAAAMKSLSLRSLPLKYGASPVSLTSQ
jgi:hypothetical protein